MLIRGLNRSMRRSGGAQLSLAQLAYNIMRKYGATLIGQAQNVTGDGAPNLLTAPEDLSASSWSKSGITPTHNAALAPDNTVTATKLVAPVSATDAYHTAYATWTVVTGAAYTYSRYVKAAEYTKIRVADIANGRWFASFDLVTGQVTNTGGPGFVSASLTAVPGTVGWWRLSLTINSELAGTAGLDAQGYPNTGATLTNWGVTYAGDGVSGVYVWGAKFEPGTVATSYTPQSVLRQRGAFTDSTGVTPVTALADLFGLVLDRMGTVGPELCTDPTISNPASWSAYGAGTNPWTTNTGALVCTTTSSGNRWVSLVGVSLTAGKTYRIECDAVVTAGGFLPDVSATPVYRTTSGRASWTLLATTTSCQFLANSSFIGSIDNVTVKEVTGSHATQPTGNFKPSLQKNAKGNWVMSFGGDDFLNMASINTGEAGWICAGVTFGAPLANNETVFANGAGSAALKGVWLLRLAGESATSALRMGVGNGTSLTMVTAPNIGNLLGTPRVVEGGWTANSVMAGVDGQVNSVARTGNAAPAPNPALIGAYLSGFHHLGGTMTYQVISPVMPTDAERGIVRNWLKSIHA